MLIPSSALTRPYKMSPSQLQTYVDCPRKWAWRYIAKIYPPFDNAAAALGTRVHNLLEKYMKDGIAWDYTTKEGKVAAAALEHLPAPSPDALTESAFDIPSADGAIIWNGKIDFTILAERKVVDYKTTSNVDAYAKTEANLRTDPQAVIYSEVLMGRYGWDDINLMWLYLPTKGAAIAKPTKAKFIRTVNKKEFDRLDLLARKISSVHASGVNPLALKPNAKMCGVYGGCPYQSNCNLSPQEKMASIFASTKVQPTEPINMGLLDDIRARQAAEAAAQNGQTLTPAIRPPSIPPPSARPPSIPPAPPAIPGVTWHPSFVEAPKVALGQINPPPVVIVPQGEVAQGPHVLVTPQAVAAAVDAAPRPASVPPPAPKKRARRRTQAEMQAAREAGIIDSRGRPVTFTNGAPLTEAYVPASTDVLVNGLTLYVDCAPNNNYDEADHIIDEVKAIIAEEKNVADYRFIDFGHGPGMLSAGVVATVKERAISSLYLNTDTPEGKACLSGLVAAATTVVRSFR